MRSLPEAHRGLDLRNIRVRPTHGSQEHRRWDRLVASHHYLSFRRMFGKALRHVATLGPDWVALLGWQAAALKVAARDRWIGWSPQQKLRRLHLLTQNSRFVILPSFHNCPNLASRVLGLSLRRLSSDMQAVHGSPLLLAESFVDPAKFRGTCYLAANWRHLGRTGGFARRPGATPRWRRHDQPKEVFVYPLQPDAAQTLRSAQLEPALEQARPGPPPDTPQLRSMYEFLGAIPDYRGARGKRYSLQTVLTLALGARLAGYRGVTAIAQFGGLLSQDQRKAVDCFFSPSKLCYTTPNTTTFHNILATLPPDTLEDAAQAWAQQQSAQLCASKHKTADRRCAADPASDPDPFAKPAVCMDGKDVRGASKQAQDGRVMLFAAVEQGSGLVLGQMQVDSKTNEIPALPELADKLQLAGRVITADALHCQQKTARFLLQECDVHYLVTAVKDNQPTMAQELREMDFSDCPVVETHDKLHGRSERRRCWVKDLSGEEIQDKAQLHGRKQAIRIERKRCQRRRGKAVKTSIEVCYAPTSLAPAEATPEQLADLIRNHWHIENRLHYVRDFSYDEDRCRVYVRDLPRNLACLSNTAISLIRCQTRFRYIPEANRHYAARQQEALELLLIPPKR